jgi:hypothetical protein
MPEEPAQQRLKPLRGQGSTVFKLCGSSDLLSVLQGLELAFGFDEPLAGLLDEVSVEPGSGRLVRGPRFTAKTRAAQPGLDTLLVEQLALASPGSSAAALRDAIRVAEIAAVRMPSLTGFCSLERLELKLSFVPDVSDLACLGALPQLQHLELTLTQLPEPIDLQGLSACPHLRGLRLVDVGPVELGQLACMTQLEKLEVDHCAALLDASALQELPALRTVAFRDCSALKNLPSTWPRTLEWLTLEKCPGLAPIAQLPPVERLAFDAASSWALFSDWEPQALATALSRVGADFDVPRLWKLLNKLDAPTVNRALRIATSCLSCEQIATLLADVSVRDGELVRGPAYVGSSVSQPYIDLALMGLLSASTAPAANAIRNSVKRMKLHLGSHAIPMVGFDALEQLELVSEQVDTPDLAGFGLMPALKELKWEAWETSTFSRGLRSLRGLQAPALEKVFLSGQVLKDLTGLDSSSSLVDVCIWRTGITNVEALAPSSRTLERVSLANCQWITSLSGLEGSVKLERLDLGNCLRLASLDSLQESTRLRRLEIDGCKAITSLRPLSGISALEEIYLDGCDALESFEGLAQASLNEPPEPKLGSGVRQSELKLTGMAKLGSLDGLPAMPWVQVLQANRSGLRDIAGIARLPGVERLSLSECGSLVDVSVLGQLQHLKLVELHATAIEELPTHWQAPLEVLDVHECKALVSLGKLPETLCKADARGCTALKTLAGLEGCRVLREVGFHPGIENARALAGRRSMNVHLHLSDAHTRPTQALVQALAEMPELRLIFSGRTRLETFDFCPIGRLDNLVEIDATDASASVASDLRWIVGLTGLRSLRLLPRSAEASRWGTSVFDSPSKVRRLQRQVCEAYDMRFPGHLE